MLTESTVDRYRHSFDEAAFIVLHSEMKRVRNNVYLHSIVLSDANIPLKDKISIVINSLFIDLLGSVSGRVLEWKYNKEFTHRKAIAKSKQIFSWICLFLCFVFMQWYIYYYLTHHTIGPMGLDWCASAVLWAVSDIFFVNPLRIFFLEVFIPSYIFSEIKDTKRFIIDKFSASSASGGNDRYVMEKSSFLFDNEVIHESFTSKESEVEVECSPFNASKYFSCAFRLASIHNGILETAFVKKYVNPLPSKSIFEKYEQISYGYKDVSSYVLDTFMGLPNIIQEMVVKLLALGLLAGAFSFFLICIHIDVLFVLIPFYIVLILAIWLSVVIFKWWKFKMQRVHRTEVLKYIDKSTPSKRNVVVGENYDESNSHDCEDEIRPMSDVVTNDKVDDVLDRFLMHLRYEDTVSSRTQNDMILSSYGSNVFESENKKILQLARLVSSSRLGEAPKSDNQNFSDRRDVIVALRKKAMITSEMYKFGNEGVQSLATLPQDLSVNEQLSMKGLEELSRDLEDNPAMSEVGSASNFNHSSTVSVFSFDKEVVEDKRNESHDREVSVISDNSGESIVEAVEKCEAEVKNCFSDELKPDILVGKSTDANLLEESKTPNQVESQMEEKFSNDLIRYREEMEQMLIDHRKQLTNMQIEIQFLRQAARNRKTYGTGDIVNNDDKLKLDSAMDGVDELCFLRELLTNDTDDFPLAFEDRFMSHINNSIDPNIIVSPSISNNVSLVDRDKRILVKGFATAFCAKSMQDCIDRICGLKFAEFGEDKARQDALNHKKSTLEKAILEIEKEVVAEVSQLKASKLNEMLLLVDQEISEEVERRRSIASLEAQKIVEEETTKKILLLKSSMLKEARVQTEKEIAIEKTRIRAAAFDAARIQAEKEVAAETDRVITEAMTHARLQAEKEAIAECARIRSAMMESARAQAEEEAAAEIARVRASALQAARLQAEEKAEETSTSVRSMDLEKQVEQENILITSLEELNSPAAELTIVTSKSIPCNNRRDTAIKKLDAKHNQIAYLNPLQREKEVLEVMLKDCHREFKTLQMDGNLSSEEFSNVAEQLTNETEVLERNLSATIIAIEEDLSAQPSSDISQSDLKCESSTFLKADSDSRRKFRRATAIVKVSDKNKKKSGEELSLAEEYPLQKERAVLESMLFEARDELKELYAVRDSDTSFVPTQDWLDSVNDLEEEIENLQIELDANRLEIDADDESRAKRQPGDMSNHGILDKNAVSASKTSINDGMKQCQANVRESRLSMRHMEPSQRLSLRRSTTMQRMSVQGMTPSLGEMIPLQKERAILESMLEDATRDLNELLAEKETSGLAETDDWKFCVEDLQDEISSIHNELLSNGKHMSESTCKSPNRSIDCDISIHKPDISCQTTKRRATAIVKVSDKNKKKGGEELSLAEEYPLQKERAVLESMLFEARDELKELYAVRDSDTSFVPTQDWLDSVNDLEEEIENLQIELDANRLEIDADDESRAKRQPGDMSNHGILDKNAASVNKTSITDGMNQDEILSIQKDLITNEERIVDSKESASLSPVMESDKESPESLPESNVLSRNNTTDATKKNNAPAHVLSVGEESRNTRNSSRRVSIRESRLSMRHMGPSQRLSLRRSTTMQRMSVQGMTPSLSEMFPLQKERAILESMLEDATRDLNELLAEKEASGLAETDDWKFCVEDLQDEISSIQKDLNTNEKRIVNSKESTSLSPLMESDKESPELLPESNVLSRNNTTDVTKENNAPAHVLSANNTIISSTDTGSRSDVHVRQRFEKEVQLAEARLHSVDESMRNNSRRVSIRESRMSMRHMEPSQRLSLRRSTTMQRMSVQGMTPSLGEMFPLQKERAILESMLEDATRDLNELLAEKEASGLAETDDWKFCVEDLQDEISSIQKDLNTNEKRLVNSKESTSLSPLMESDKESPELLPESNVLSRNDTTDVTKENNAPAHVLSAKNTIISSTDTGSRSDVHVRQRFEKEAQLAEARLHSVDESMRNNSRRVSIRESRMSMRHMEPSQRLSLRRSTTMQRMSVQGMTPSLGEMFPLQKERAILESMLEDATRDLNELLAEKETSGLAETDDWKFCVKDLQDEISSIQEDLRLNHAHLTKEKDLYDI